MATLVLSAAGAAIGSGVGTGAFLGGTLGLTGAVVGRAAGAVLGRAIDQRLLGLGSAPVPGGRIERLRLTGAGEGVALPRVWGRMRVPGHVIWASDFQELPGRSRRSKGGLGPHQTEASRYVISLAVALCEGPITGLGRVWANGVEIAPRDMVIRLYHGTDDQAPDPAIEAIEGAGMAPAYRGTAYVVIEDMDLGPWGNRLPSLAFEVIRAAQAPGVTTLQDAVRAVAWMPGSGEYALATEPVLVEESGGVPGLPAEQRVANVNSPRGESDLAASVDALQAALPLVQSGLLIVSWFGDDLRCADCTIRPKVEYGDRDSPNQPWRLGGLSRSDVPELARLGGGPVYGGTPSDQSVIQSIHALQAAGQAVVYYPFILMDVMEGNSLPNPWTGEEGQPPLPWRGRITTALAPGLPGTPDRSAAAEAEVAAFFGTAQPGDFTIGDGAVTYTGPDEWSYRRFILHQAALCAAAGGVDAFCVGSEMRGLTQIRGAGDSFPAVAALRLLLADVRAMLGPEVKLTYAADWSEYWGYNDGQGNRYFHLDPLWADDDCDVIAIDNYMPLSDWREGDDHADARAGWRSIYDIDYLKANVAGGEGYDWFYPDTPARRAQDRVPITDGANAQPWVFRYKDLLNWWRNAHVDRIGGVPVAEPTDWAPASKPVWFTEFGCAAIDKGTNQPNVFLDPKSSESFVPYFSTGARDDVIQMQYLRAMAEYWQDPAHNPVSPVYGAPMVDWARAHVWAWDARPWPWFPGNAALWDDAANWARGHWITGRAANQPLAAVVAEICARAGVADADVSGLYGVVRGYAVASTDTPRAMLQPLMLAHGIEAVERGGKLVFRMRDGRVDGSVAAAALVAGEGASVTRVRAAQPETAARVRLGYVDAEGDFEVLSAETVHPDAARGGEVTQADLPLALTRGEARGTVKRWMAEARVARETARFALPPSAPWVVGDVLALPGGGAYRIDRMELTGARAVEAVRVEAGVYRGTDLEDDPAPARAFLAPAPVQPVFLDLPLMRGDEVAHAPHLAVSARPWPGSVAVYDAPLENGDLALNRQIAARATLGVTLTPLDAARPGRWQRGPVLEVRLQGPGGLADATRGAVLAGANLLALGNGVDWELIQFEHATLIAPGRWILSGFLRGQFGTDAVMPLVWPPGTAVARVDGALVQPDLPLAGLGLARRWRIGPAALPLDDIAYVERVEAFRGVGLRPYAPVHLRVHDQDGAMVLRWIRRTRIGGDGWDGPEVPLGEESERYQVRVLAAGAVLREVTVSEAEWIYTPAMQAADGIAGAFVLAVAQVSALWGTGPFATLPVEG
ncbi:MAG: baseplate multidomain protein megatron [Pararhodobacter sp.]